MKRLAVLVIFAALVSFGVQVLGGYNTVLAEAQDQVATVRAELAAEREARAEAAAEYETTLQRIAAALSSRIAGGTEGGRGTLLEAILNETREHDLAGLVLPLRGAVRVTSPFGWRLSPFGPYVTWHEGVDLYSDRGEVYAVADGIVVEHWPPPDDYYRGHPQLGGLVRLAHGGSETVYGHLAAIEPLVREGQRVSQGDKLGRMGNTGRSAGRHLHYALYRDGKPVDPFDEKVERRELLR